MRTRSSPWISTSFASMRSSLSVLIDDAVAGDVDHLILVVVEDRLAGFEPRPVPAVGDDDDERMIAGAADGEHHRLGARQRVRGEAVGLQVLDLVEDVALQPLDLHELNAVASLTRRRTARPMASATRSASGLTRRPTAR